jgi:hypothetical protein
MLLASLSRVSRATQQLNLKFHSYDPGMKKALATCCIFHVQFSHKIIIIIAAAFGHNGQG